MSQESSETWEDKTLCGIFRFTLDQAVLYDAHRKPLHFLPGTRVELEEQGRNVQMTTSILEQAILEAASNPKDEAPLDYLLACWKRVSRLFRGMRNNHVDATKQGIVKEARRLCMSYCIFAITMPDMFGSVHPSFLPCATETDLEQRGPTSIESAHPTSAC